jgi:hypothetical protein
MDIGAPTIRKWHLERGFNDIGYAKVIKRNGIAEGGRDTNNNADYFDDIGAHVKGYNAQAVGICLVGGVKEDGKTPDFNFTRRQMKTLEEELKILKGRFPKAEIVGHRDLGNKDCPCFDVKSWWYG